MSRKPLMFALLLAGLGTTAQAEDTFRSPPAADAHKAGVLAAMRAERAKPGARAAAVTAEEVGDADSFGRNVKWLGLVAGSVYLAPDCTPLPGEPATPNCVTLNPAGGFTSFNVPDIATLTLPGRSSHSLLCHWQTPIVNYFAANNGAGPGNFQLLATPTYRIESEVLNEPGLLDPNTGLPYGGVINTSLTAILKSNTLGAGESQSEVLTGARMCIASLINRNALINQYGLSEAQATRFFRRPITITLGIRGNAVLVEEASIYFGTRFVGD